MGLLDVHAAGIQNSFDFALRNPAAAEPPASFNLWSFGSAGFGGIKRGLTTDLGANVADFAKLYQGEEATNPLETEAQQRERDADRAQRTQALSQLNAGLRLRSAEQAPDPLSAHRADQVISSLGAGLGRAVGSVATMGPIAGGVVFGSAEADTAYHEARDAGVDEQTALKLAGTTGVFSGVTAGLPAVGSTIPKTLGLIAATGPGSYVASEVIAKKILQSANYNEQAALHDPTDPLGLALSIAIPGVIGGLHIRALAKAPPSIAEVALGLESGGKRTGADGQLLTSPKGAQGEMQVMPATQLDPGFGVRPAALGPDGKPTADEIARVGTDYIAAMQNRYGGDAAKTLAAYNAGPGALDAAISAHGDGWLAHMPEETQKYVAKGVAKLGEGGVAHASQDPDNVDAARVHLVNRAITDNLPDHPEAFAELQRATDSVSRGPIVETTSDPARIQLESELRDVEAQHAQALADEPSSAEAQHQTSVVAELIQRQAEITRQLEALPLTSVRPAQLRPTAAAARDVLMARDSVTIKAPKAEPVPKDMFAPKPVDEAGAPVHEAPPAGLRATEAPKPEPKPGAGAAEKPAAPVKVEPPSLHAQRADATIAENPELKVQMGKGDTISASEMMQQARSEAQHDLGERDLFRAALQCALTFGV